MSTRKLFDEIPCLEGERLVVKRMTENDRAVLQEMAHSNAVYRYEPTYLLEQQYEDMDMLLGICTGSILRINRT